MAIIYIWATFDTLEAVPDDGAAKIDGEGWDLS